MNFYYVLIQGGRVSTKIFFNKYEDAFHNCRKVIDGNKDMFGAIYDMSHSLITIVQ